MGNYERACTAHADTPYEAETVQRGTLTYLVLRCPRCQRPQGERLVRRATEQGRG